MEVSRVAKQWCEIGGGAHGPPTGGKAANQGNCCAVRLCMELLAISMANYGAAAIWGKIARGKLAVVSP